MIALSRFIRLFTAMILLGMAVSANAEQMEQFGDYRIHYNAFVSNMLNPDVARAHGLTRSRYHAVVNITVQKQDNGSYQPVSATVSGTATNLYGKLRKLEMKKVTERDAIYYLAELPFSDKEILNFDIQVMPEGESVAHNIRFKQQFFVD